jgi:hypothetical protein
MSKKMKNTIVWFMIPGLLFLLAVGCAKQEKVPRQLTLSSLYDVESGSFILDGYVPQTGWRELCDSLGISLDGLKKDEHRYYIKDIVEIYLNSEGRVRYGEVMLDGKPAGITYVFYREKLYGVHYDFELGEQSSEERTALATEMDAALRKEFSNLEFDSDGKLGGIHSARRVWYAGEESAMSCLLLSTSADSMSGEVSVGISVICDIPEKELATTHYTDRFGDALR